MNTIKFFFILSAVLFTSVLKGQASINQSIQATLDAFIDHSNKNEWDKAFDLLYPKLFTKVPKQELVNIMVSTEADGMSLKMYNTHITSTSVPVEEGNETFVRFEYVSDMEVRIKPGGIYDHPKAIQAMDEEFKATYGNSNVKWDADFKVYKIIAHKAMMAIKTSEGVWKLVEINMDKADLMAYLFSPYIMDALVRVE